jgi:hypothetical protein
VYSKIIPGVVRVEAAALRIRIRKTADPDLTRRPGGRLFPTVVDAVTVLWAIRRRRLAPWLHLVALGISLSISSAARAEIPWPEVAQRLAYENERLARRPGGYAGEYFIVCTLYYTPKESGFTFERGFDATRITRPGLHGHTYPRDFLRSVMKEGYGRITMPVNGRNYIRYSRGSYGFAGPPSGGGGTLVARYSAAARLSGPLRRGLVLETPAPEVQSVFGSTRWKVMDTGGGLHRWQLDCYYGEDEPLGPGRLMARPRSTTFEYAYSTARVSK